MMRLRTCASPSSGEGASSTAAHAWAEALVPNLGWVGFDGAMDTNILIRTFTAGRGRVQFPVGGGIVADSDPGAEWLETLDKAGVVRDISEGGDIGAG